jgi:hypothetical protein
MKHTWTREVPGSPASAYTAALEVAQANGYRRIVTEPEMLRLTFNSGMSMCSWEGQSMTATLSLNSDESACRVVVSGGDSQLISWVEGGRVARHFLDELASRAVQLSLNNPPSPCPVSLLKRDSGPNVDLGPDAPRPGLVGDVGG